MALFLWVLFLYSQNIFFLEDISIYFYIMKKIKVIYSLLLITILSLFFLSCEPARPNKKATIVITRIMGGKDTVCIEYRDNLRIDDQNRLVDVGEGSVKAKYVVNFSILGSITEIK